MSAATRNTAIVILGGIALGVYATTVNLYYVAAVIGAAVLIVLVAWKFEAALTVYVLFAFIPWGESPGLAVGGSGMSKGVGVSQSMLGFLLLIWFGKYLFSTLPRQRIRSGFYIPIVLYLVYSIINVAHSYLFWDPQVNKIHQYLAVNFVEIGIRFLSAGAFAMMATTVSSGKWLKWMTIFLLVPGFYNLFNAAIKLRIPISAPWWPLMSMFAVSYLWVMALDRYRSWVARLVLTLLTAATVMVVLVWHIGWVSGWLGLLTALGTITLLKNRRLFVVLVVLGVIAVSVFKPFFTANVVEESEHSGDYERFKVASVALRYATTFPLGVGLGNYRTYTQFHYGALWGCGEFSSAHGTYAQHLSEMGFPGTILFVSILVSGFVWLLKNRDSVPDGMSRTFIYAAMGQLVGITCAAYIGDYIIPAYHNGGLGTFSCTIYSWLTWGLAVAHVRIAKAKLGKDSEY